MGKLQVSHVRLPNSLRTLTKKVESDEYTAQGGKVFLRRGGELHEIETDNTRPLPTRFDVRPDGFRVQPMFSGWPFRGPLALLGLVCSHVACSPTIVALGVQEPGGFADDIARGA